MKDLTPYSSAAPARTRRRTVMPGQERRGTPAATTTSARFILGRSRDVTPRKPVSESMDDRAVVSPGSPSVMTRRPEETAREAARDQRVHTTLGHIETVIGDSQ